METFSSSKSFKLETLVDIHDLIGVFNAQCLRPRYRAVRWLYKYFPRHLNIQSYDNDNDNSGSSSDSIEIRNTMSYWTSLLHTPSQMCVVIKFASSSLSSTSLHLNYGHEGVPLPADELCTIQRVLVHDLIPCHIPLPPIVPIDTMDALLNHDLDPLYWVIGHQETSHPNQTCFHCGRCGHMMWNCISHQCAICHQYTAGHNQAHCPVHLTWEAFQFTAAERAYTYHEYDIALADVITYIWD